uniref:Uncharacterized protein n=1 Tax=Arundo donax TaxID=35708 RepID=A0A0A8YGH0_ARUDO
MVHHLLSHKPFQTVMIFLAKMNDQTTQIFQQHLPFGFQDQDAHCSPFGGHVKSLQKFYWHFQKQQSNFLHLPCQKNQLFLHDHWSMTGYCSAIGSNYCFSPLSQ